MAEKGQVIEHEDGSADIIFYTESPSGYPRPHVIQLTKNEYSVYKKRIAVSKRRSIEDNDPCEDTRQIYPGAGHSMSDF